MKYMDEKETHVWETHELYGKYLANIWETPEKTNHGMHGIYIGFPEYIRGEMFVGKKHRIL